MRVVVLGGVTSTSILLSELVAHEFDVVAVFGYSPRNPSKVAGWADLRSQSQTLGLPYHAFTSVNSDEVRALLTGYAPDVVFAVGLSQLIPDDLVRLPSYGVVGFHPTKLPSGRGRAPMAWLTERGESGAATFFEINAGVDEGGIFVDEKFEVLPGDHAEDVYERMYDATRRALRRWLPDLRDGHWSPEPQSAEGASYWGRRVSSDGHIDWQRTVDEVDALVRAASHPHPGAYTYLGDERVDVVRTYARDPMKTSAFPGTIMWACGDDTYVVQAGDGPIRVVLKGTKTDEFRIGTRLGYSVQAELQDLRQRLARLEAQIGLAE